ncbi:MAG TPA: hypothetical protein VM938_03605 [Acidimicrobiales bacterium]|nr:hypothetical protein [Acidimicrobiales bacterium]
MQDALLNDERTPDVEAHLDRCPACADVAARIDAVRTNAGALGQVLAPPAPAGLADRVLDHVRSGDGAAVRQGVAPRRGPWLTDAARHSLTRSTAIAAALLLVVGALAVLARPEDDRGDDVLLASAERTEAAGTAQVTVEGETELLVPVEYVAPGNGGRGPVQAARPPFEAFPPEVRVAMEAQWAQAMAEFERGLAAFQAQVDEAIRRGQEQIDRALRDAVGGGGGGGSGRPPSTRPTTPPRAAGAPPKPPSSLSLRMAVSAGGTTDFRGRVNLEGTVRPAVPATALEAGPAGFAVSVDGRQAALRRPDGSWAALQSSSGPLGAVLLEPGAVGRILRSSEGDVETLGDAELDGSRVRRYRFEVDPAALVRTEFADQHWTAEASVDSDGRVRALRLQARGGVDRRSPLTWQSDVTVRLRDFGTPPAPRPAGAVAPQGTVAGGGRSSVLVHPFGPTVAASLESSSSESR